MTNLRVIRKHKGLTLKQLGNALGLAESTISQYELGSRQPDYDTLLQIADYFNVSTDYLLGRQIEDPFSQRFRENVNAELNKVSLERRTHMDETEKKLLHEVMLNLITTIDCYCDFIKVFMKQEQNKPDGITVSPHEFQDGFRALNHLTVSLARIERALAEFKPDAENS